MKVTIDLQAMLATLQALDIANADIDDLLQLSMKLGFIENALQNGAQCQNYFDLITSVLTYAAPIRQELRSRGVNYTTLDSVLDSNPEILGKAIAMMSPEKLAELYSSLQANIQDDPEALPLYELVAEMLQQRTNGNMPS